MKKHKLLSFIFHSSIATLFLACPIVAQDARVYYEGLYYTGPYIDINIGETKYVQTDGDEFCVDILNSNAAIKASAYEKWAGNGWAPVNFFIYTEQDFPEVFGTDQYEDVRMKIECLTKATNWRELPQPELFVPFDFSSSNPNPENDSNLMPFVASHRMLVKRRAFIWENSEDITGIHAPYGDIKIGVCPISILYYSEEQLVQDNSLWRPTRLSKSDLSGPIWSGYAPMWYPDPYDEWIDGPFGCIYSNIAVWDWGTNPDPAESIAIVISEADDPEAFMGKSQNAITPFIEGPILIKVWGFGWVVLENIWVPASGKEQSVSQGDVYWYGGWDGVYPVEVYGPTNPAVPNQNSYGSQFKPFTDELFWQFHNNSNFDGYTVGLLGTNFPKCTLNRPRIYKVIDPEKPVVFGK